MPLDPLVVEDLQASWAAVRKGRALEFSLVPAQSPSDPPWLLVDKGSQLRTRVLAATKHFARLGYARPRQVTGRLELVSKRLVFVLPEADETFEALLRGRWATRLLAEEDGQIKKLGALLKRASAVTEAQWAESGAPAGDGASEDEEPEVAAILLEAFGEVASEVEEALPTLAELGELLADREPAKPRSHDQTDQLLRAVGTADARTLAALVPSFLKVATLELSASSEPLAVGAKLDPGDQSVAVAGAFGAWMRALVAWERLLEQGASLLETVDDLERRAETLTEDEQEARVEFLEQYNRVRVASLAAETRAEALRRDVTTELGALQSRLPGGAT